MGSTACHLGLLTALLLVQSFRGRVEGSGDCPADGWTWVPFGQSCYYFVHNADDVFNSYTIQEAKQKCKDFGLLKVPNAEVNKFIVEHSRKVWNSNVSIWLGMYYNPDDEGFKWNDESPVNFNNWVEADPGDWDEPVMDTCVALVTSSGQWENVSCSQQNEDSVVCEAGPTSTQKGTKNGSPLLTVLVILSVITILGISTVLWFLQQRNNSGLPLFPSFEYQPPFGSASADETCLVEAEELEETS